MDRRKENITELTLSGVFTALVCLLTMYEQERRWLILRKLLGHSNIR